ncbi:MAG: autotransporter domain-containing protein [Pseudomonadota bacterium]
MPIAIVSVAAIAVALVLIPAQAWAACALDAQDPTVAHCTGDLSAGVSNADVGGAVTVNVNALTDNITPALGVTGINLSEAGNESIVLNVDTGSFSIITPANPGGMTGDGIAVRETGLGNLEISFTGTIMSDSDGIEAHESGAGDVRLDLQAGMIDATGSGPDVGINVSEFDGGSVHVTLGAALDVSARGEGLVVVEAGDGDVVVEAHGDIDVIGSSSVGIRVEEAGPGGVSITTGGAITANGERARGIQTFQTGATGLTTIAVMADVSANGVGAYGIYATGPELTVSIGDGVAVSGGNAGQSAPAGGIWLSGDVVQLTIGRTATVTAGSGLAIGTNAGRSATITTAGNIDGDVSLGSGDDTLDVLSGGHLGGAVDFGFGDDTLKLNPGAEFRNVVIDGGTGSNDLVELTGNGIGVFDNDVQHQGFERLAKEGLSTWTLRGDHTFSDEVAILRGTLDVDGTVTTAQFNNFATLAVGGVGRIGRATVDGNYFQRNDGTYAVDVNLLDETVDHLTVTGDATLDGSVNVNILAYASGRKEVTILTAAGGINRNALSVNTLSGQVVSLQLNDVDVQTVGDDVVLVFSVDPDLSTPVDGDLNPNQRRIAQAIDAVDAGGSGVLDPVVSALISGPTNIDAYRDALDVLLPEVYLNTETAMLFSAQDFLADLFSCPTVGDGAAVVREGQCLWVRPKGRKFDRDATFENIGYDDTVGGVSAGAQFRFAPGWFANIGGSYERGSLSTDTGAESDSDRFHVGSAVKYEMGPWLFAGAVAGGIGSFDTSRPIAFVGFNDGTARSEHDVRYIAGQLRTAYQFAMPGWYMRPLVDLNIIYLDREGVTEIGAGTTNLMIDGGEETVFSATPGVEFGGTYEVIPGATLKPFLMAGLTVFADDEHSVTSAFALAPDVTFETVTEHGDVFAKLHAGTILVGDTSDFNLTLGYQGLYTDNVTQHGVYAKGALKF